MNRVNLVLMICLMFIFAGCSKKELEKLNSENQHMSTENQQLKSKIAAMEQEIAKLKETADYHYQQGMALLSSEKYGEAKTEFQTVIEKYPISSLVASAKQQLIKVNIVLVKIEAERKAEEKRQEAHRRAEERQRQKAERDKWPMLAQKIGNAYGDYNGRVFLDGLSTTDEDYRNLIRRIAGEPNFVGSWMGVTIWIYGQNNGENWKNAPLSISVTRVSRIGIEMWSYGKHIFPE